MSQENSVNIVGVCYSALKNIVLELGFACKSMLFKRTGTW